ncbi:MAG: penicillin-binding protein 2 [Candidatus Sericytochromatia bacterium]|nr:penicillin-binding protein 2 [Candidatus Sericytochromatia bacterium]
MMDVGQAPSRARTLLLGGVLGLGLLAVLARLGQLQLMGGQDFRERAEGNRLRVILEPAPRGLVRDRNGQVLANNRLSYSVTLYPIKLSRQQTEEVIGRLGHLLGVPAVEIRQKWRRAISLPVRVKTDVDDRTIAIVAENQARLPGVSIEPITVRHYPRGHLAAHLLGHTGEITERELDTLGEGYRQGDIIGKTGLERVFDGTMRGEPGKQQVEVDARGRAIRTLAEVAPIPGKDVTLALDGNLQALAERELKGKLGAVVCMDPRNGEVLALASAPSFNPNIFAGRLRPEDWKAVNAPTRPLLNRAISSAYPPGSTFKIVTSVAALEAGLVKANTRFWSSGEFVLGNRVFRDWKEGGFGNVNFVDAMIHSIDTVYYELGLKLGVDRMAARAREMGLGRRTGILLPGEVQGIIPDGSWKLATVRQRWTKGDSVNMSIGQGFVTCTPLQLAVMLSTVANGGRLVRPKLLRPAAPEESEDPGALPAWQAATWQYLKHSLRRVVEAGTGAAAFHPKYSAAGKTGSAEAVKGQKTHAWFVGYTPADQPRLVVVVFAEKAGHGGSIAAPIAGKLFRQFHGLPVDPVASGSATSSIAAPAPANRTAVRAPTVSAQSVPVAPVIRPAGGPGPVRRTLPTVPADVPEPPPPPPPASPRGSG